MNRIIMLFALALMMGACGTTSTKITNSWKKDNESPKNYNRLAILFFTPNTGGRALVEEALYQKLRSKGINAYSTFDVFPLAGKVNEIDMGITREELEQKVQDKIHKAEIDALLIVTLLDVEQEERYVQGTSIGVGVGFPMMHPAYGMSYFGYYGYAYGTVYDSGYWTQTSNYFIESNLYDIESELLIYSAQSQSIEVSNVDKEALKFADVLVYDLLSKKVLEKK